LLFVLFADDCDLVLEHGEGVDGPNLSLLVLIVRSQPDGLRLMMLGTGPNRSLIARPKALDAMSGAGNVSFIELPRGEDDQSIERQVMLVVFFCHVYFNGK
jgi:hypothetical protein